MNNTFTGYVNYGCLGAEKRAIFTAGNPEATATTSEPVEYTIPDEWKIELNASDNVIITAPWGWKYEPNELLQGNQDAYFGGYNKDGEMFRVKLEWKKL